MVEVLNHKDVRLVAGVVLTIVLFITLTVLLLMRPKSVAVPTVLPTVTPPVLPTITPLPTMTPFPTPTARPTRPVLQSPTPTAEPSATPVTSAVLTETTVMTSTDVITYVVQPGDTVSEIATNFGISVAALLIANDIDEETIFPEQVLLIPAGEEFEDLEQALVHTVRAGDTLGTIAAQYDVTVTAIKQANDLDSDIIQLGQKLVIPRD